MSGKKRSLCPQCGKHASGNFCQNCGSTLGGKFCNKCGGEVAPDGKFCNQCGAGIKGSQGRGAARRAAKAAASSDVLAKNDTPWLIAGAAVFALILVMGWNAVQSSRAPRGPAAAATTAAPVPVDLSQLSPRQQADEFFNRVMAAAENGDTVLSQQFMPMAVQAYETARPLDLDGLLHLAMLHRTAGQFEQSLSTVQEILAVEENHILGLEVAGEVTAAMGREAEAVGYYQRILANYDVEAARPLMEYQSHAGLMGRALEGARTFLAGR